LTENVFYINDFLTSNSVTQAIILKITIHLNENRVEKIYKNNLTQIYDIKL